MNIPSANHSLLGKDSNSNTNSINSFTKHSILMDYLVKKLEMRIKLLPRTRMALGNIYTQQDLVENKKEMIKHFFEIEDDLKQGVDAIKALLSQNRDLTEQLEISTERASNHEIKSIGDINIMNELNERNNSLIDECNMMRQMFCEIQEKSSRLQEKILEFQNEFKSKERYIEELKHKNKLNFEGMEKVKEENIFFKMQIENLNNKLENLSNHNVNLDSKIYGTENDFANLDSILAEKEKNKKLIEEKIKKHFNNKFSDEDEKKEKGNDVNEIAHVEKNILKHNKYVEKETATNNHKKENLISKIMMMALESEENINHLNKKFGADFMEKLLNPDVSDLFLEKIEESLKYKNSPLKKNSGNKRNPSNQSDEEYNQLNSTHINNEDICNKKNIEEGYQANFSSHDNFIKPLVHNSKEKDTKFSEFSKISHHKRSKSFGVIKPKVKKGHLLNFPKGHDYKTFDTNISFQNTLRHYRSIRSPSTGKVFVNFTNPYGNFFDDSLQKGGKSKLENRLMKST